MADDSWQDTLPSILRGPLMAYKHRRTIHSLWKRLQVYLNVGSTNIVVVGTSGSGKSVLSSHLHGEANSLEWVPPAVSRSVETHPISIDDWTNIVRVIPGGTSKERSEGIVEAFQMSKSLTGVIYVASGGYPKIREMSIASQLVNKDRLTTIKKFSTFQRKNEAADLREICNRVLDMQALGRSPSFFVVALNKCDLFMDRLDEFHNYYALGGSGDAARVLNDFARHADTQRLKIGTIPVCALPEDFVWNDEVLPTQIRTVTENKNAIRNFLNELAPMSRT